MLEHLPVLKFNIDTIAIFWNGNTTSYNDSHVWYLCKISRVQLDHQTLSSTKPTNIKFCYLFLETNRRFVCSVCLWLRPSWIRKITIPRSRNIWSKKIKTPKHGKVSSNHHLFGVKFSGCTAIAHQACEDPLSDSITSPNSHLHGAFVSVWQNLRVSRAVSTRRRTKKYIILLMEELLHQLMWF